MSQPELSLLDYLKARRRTIQWPWLSISGLALALLAQYRLEPTPQRSWESGAAIYAIAAILVAWGCWRGEWRAAPPPVSAPYSTTDPLTVRTPALIIGLLFGLAIFLASGGNRFTWINLAALSLALIFLLRAFWLPDTQEDRGEYEFITNIENGIPGNTITRFLNSLKKVYRERGLTLHFTLWNLLVCSTFIVAAFFRFYQLSQVPLEMNSDHAEKILDITRVLAGQTLIFFPNNGGREALQMYLVAGLHKFLNVDLDFMALKIITSLAGFLSLPFIYMLGREVANRRVGLLAMAFAGVAYWPNVVSRLGLRLPFYILFTAAFLYFLLRGLRTNRRNDFILAGIILGFSLYGYSADRILPLLMIVAVCLFLLHKPTPAEPSNTSSRRQIIWFSIMATVFAVVIFLPMLRYLIESPDSFLYRSLTRMSELEQPLPGPAWLILLRNTGRALVMFLWSDGEVWTASVPYRPALDIASGALFWCGVIVILVSYIRKRKWPHLFLLISIPVLMLPSIMALAFPNENPNLYRTGGAMVPAFLIIGIALDGFMRSLQKKQGELGRRVAWIIVVLLFVTSSFQSYHLVFRQYRDQYSLSAWNTSEMAQVAQNFAGSFGTLDHIWIVGYPHWADTRLVAILTGNPLHDFLIEHQEIGNLEDDGNAKLFLIRPEDEAGLRILEEYYPQGTLKAYTSKVPTKDFLLYFVPQN